MRIRRKPVSLFMLPYITALFLFSLYINVTDTFWHIQTPTLILYDFSFPDESHIIQSEEKTLMAYIDINLPENPQKGFENPEGAFYLTTYTVREDERLSIIAEKFSITLDSLLSVNHIEIAFVPEPGSKINIPNISGIYYKVQKGDTLTSISSRFDIDMDEISHVNQLLTTVIHIGEELFLPGIRMNEEKIEKIIQTKFIIPAAGTIKNNYGSSLDPTTGLKNYSYGIDIINTKGTAVYAAKDGIVKDVSYNSYFGRVVLLNHSGSFQSMYGCLDSVVAEQGQYVKRGELLGYIGNSGFKAYEHLQFSIFKNKEDVDTLEYIF